MVPLKELGFKFGDIVFHKTDGDVPGVITAIVQRPNSVTYEVTWQSRVVELHQDIELTHEAPKFSSSDPEDKILR